MESLNVVVRRDVVLNEENINHNNGSNKSKDYSIIISNNLTTTIMNYKSACLKTGPMKPTNIKATMKKNVVSEKERFNRSCEKAVRILTLRWEKYKEDYIALHGEDVYNRMYLTPNYWVMPEDEEVEEQQKEEEYYSSDNSF